VPPWADPLAFTRKASVKKHSKTLAEAGVVYSGSQCGIRGGDGRRPGSL